MRTLIAAIALTLLLSACAGVTGIPWKFWQDANIPCEGGELYDYRGSTCEAPDLDAF